MIKFDVSSKLFIKYIKGLKNRIRGTIMEKEPLSTEEDFSKIEEIWARLLIKLFEKIRPLKKENIKDINRFLIVLSIIGLTLKSIKIPKTEITVPSSSLILVGLFFHFILDVFPEFFEVIRTPLALIFSRRKTLYRSIIHGKETESSIRTILSDNKFTPEEYKKIIESLIKQEKFTEKTQRKIIEAIKKWGIDIRPFLKESFIAKCRIWYPSAISIFLFTADKKYQRDEEFLNKLLECYPNTSVGLAIGAFQKPNNNNPSVIAGESFSKSIYKTLRLILRIIAFVSVLWIFGKGSEVIFAMPINSQSDKNAQAFMVLFWLTLVILIVHKIYRYVNGKVITYFIKSVTHNINFEKKDLEYIIEDFIQLF